MRASVLLIAVALLASGCVTASDWKDARERITVSRADVLQGCVQWNERGGSLDQQGMDDYKVETQRRLDAFGEELDSIDGRGDLSARDKIVAAKAAGDALRCPDVAVYQNQKRERWAEKGRASIRAEKEREAQQAQARARQQQEERASAAQAVLPKAKRDAIVKGPNGEKVVEACEKIQDLDRELQDQAASRCDPSDGACNERKIATTKLVIRKFQQIEERFQRSANEKFDKVLCCDAMPKDFIMAGARCIARPLGMYAH